MNLDSRGGWISQKSQVWMKMAEVWETASEISLSLEVRLLMSSCVFLGTDVGARLRLEGGVSRAML